MHIAVQKGTILVPNFIKNKTESLFNDIKIYKVHAFSFLLASTKNPSSNLFLQYDIREL